MHFGKTSIKSRSHRIAVAIQSEIPPSRRVAPHSHASVEIIDWFDSRLKNQKLSGRTFIRFLFCGKN
ncbi:hypothetical protein [Burkholderia sp. PU8-34]